MESLGSAFWSISLVKPEISLVLKSSLLSNGFVYSDKLGK